MLAQVIFKADKELKDQALKKAKAEGITLRSLFTLCMKAYVSGKLNLSIDQSIQAEDMKVPKSIQKKMDRIEKLIQEKGI